MRGEPRGTGERRAWVRVRGEEASTGRNESFIHSLGQLLQGHESCKEWLSVINIPRGIRSLRKVFFLSIINSNVTRRVVGVLGCVSVFVCYVCMDAESHA